MNGRSPIAGKRKRACSSCKGVIDCCFKEKGGWVLLDYKTDSASDIAGVLERHRPQIELYAQALSGITGIPVRERAIYLVRAGAGYPV